MKRGAYYNEHDPFAAEWLRRLILFGHIAEGDVDERSIEDVNPDDLKGYDQCHFFAGIGVWSHALRSAGWCDDRPVWTGSCPCQPFSAAGKGGGTADERHLWPAFFHLIGERRPGVVFGEQVASKDGLGWLDLVQADMEGAGYAFGANDLCAAGFGAPHIRQRLFFVANTAIERRERRGPGEAGDEPGTIERLERLCDAGGLDDSASARHVGALGDAEGDPRDEARVRVSSARRGLGGLADASSEGRREDARGTLGDEGPHGREGRIGGEQDGDHVAAGSGAAGLLADAARGRRAAGFGYNGPARDELDGQRRGETDTRQPGPVNGLWRASDWLFCRDGRWRPVEPGTCPLAHGVAGRVGLLRGYGNAIVAPVAQGFIEAAMACIP